MKKNEIIEKLNEMNVKFNEDDTYNDLRKLLKEHELHSLEKPKQKSIEKKIEKLQEEEKETLEQVRNRLYPEIKELMNNLKGRSNATNQEITKMFSLYNQFYLRNDSASCSSCVARVYNTFLKLIKKWK